MGLLTGLLAVAIAGGPKNIVNKMEENKREKQYVKDVLLKKRYIVVMML